MVSKLNDLESLAEENVKLKGRVIELESIIDALQNHLKKNS